MKLGDPPNFPNIDEKWDYCHLCGGGHSAATDLVTNGTFASATTGWTAQNMASLSISDGGYPSGNCLTITEGGTANPCAYQRITVVAETAHQLAWMAKRGTAYKHYAYVWDSTNGVDITSTDWIDGKDDWTHHYVDFNTPVGCVEVIIYLYSNAAQDSGSTFMFDNVALYSDSGSSSPMYPESMMTVAEDGQRYCNDHWNWRFYRRHMDEIEIDITDDLD